jgi:predicted metalloprotease
MLRGRESSNIEDRRGMGGKGLALGGGGIGTVILLLLVWLCGGNPQTLLDQLGGGSAPTQQEQRQPQGNPNQQNAKSNDDQRKFVASVLGSTEDVWRKVLPQQAGRQYQDPKLVLFTDRVQSACGVAGSSTGPFYCPAITNFIWISGFSTN